MEIQKIPKSDYLDLLFDGRNKNYGSYQLRKGYSRRITLGMIFAFSVFILFFLSTLLKPKSKVVAEIPVNHEVSLTHILPPVKKPPLPPMKVIIPAAGIKKTVKVTPPVISKDDDVADADKFKLPKPEDNVVVGPADFKGSDAPGSIDPYLGQNSGNGNGTGMDIGNANTENDQTFRFVDQEAAFPGGESALAAYLQKYLRYPVSAKQHGLSGTVQIQFIIDQNGAISDVTVLRDIGGGCGEEAQRVVSGMPKWSPAKNNGHPVKSFFILPIQFDLK